MIYINLQQNQNHHIILYRILLKVYSIQLYMILRIKLHYKIGEIIILNQKNQHQGPMTINHIIIDNRIRDIRIDHLVQKRLDFKIKLIKEIHYLFIIKIIKMERYLLIRKK